MWLSVSTFTQWDQASAAFPPALLGRVQHAQCSGHCVNSSLITVMSHKYWKYFGISRPLHNWFSFLHWLYLFILWNLFLLRNLLLHFRNWSNFLQIRASPPMSDLGNLLGVRWNVLLSQSRVTLGLGWYHVWSRLNSYFLAELLSLFYALDCSPYWFQTAINHHTDIEICKCLANIRERNT